MRGLPSAIEQRLLKRVQAGDSAVRADLWISRPTVPLTEERFLEKQVLSRYSATDVSIAVDHTVPESDASNIYIAFIENGVAKVVRAAYNLKMSAHVWFETGFSEPAEYVAICFDGTMPKTTGDKIEFITDESPWVFWVLDGKLYARKLDGSETLILAESMCSSVSAIRAAGGSVSGGFDYGLCLFFLLNGEIYVRQCISGEWMDAEPINFGPDVTWVDIAACRSWDYRVVLQALAEDGSVYELFTQYMGIGQRSTEHIEVKGVKADGTLTEIGKTDAKAAEHIEITGIDAGALYGGLYSLDLPSFRSAKNVPVEAMDEEGTAYEDWGKVVLVELTVHLEPASVANNAARFVLTDSKGRSFVAASAEPINADGLTLKLTFADINMASGLCTIAYTPGTVNTMYGLAAETMSVQFTPENLIAPSVPAPEAVSAWLLEPDGTKLAVRFTEEIVSGADTTDGWRVIVPEFDYVPSGTLSNQERAITEITGYAGTTINIDFSEAALTDIMFNRGELSLEVDA